MLIYSNSHSLSHSEKALHASCCVPNQRLSWCRQTINIQSVSDGDLIWLGLMVTRYFPDVPYFLFILQTLGIHITIRLKHRVQHIRAWEPGRCAIESCHVYDAKSFSIPFKPTLTAHSDMAPSSAEHAACTCQSPLHSLPWVTMCGLALLFIFHTPGTSSWSRQISCICDLQMGENSIGQNRRVLQEKWQREPNSLQTLRLIDHG